VLLVTLIALGGESNRWLLVTAILVAGAASFVPLRYWGRVGPTLVRHPAWFAAELVLSALILVLTGVQSPFFYYTLGTALLGGLVYGAAGAAVFAPILVGVYLWVLEVRSAIETIPDTFQTWVGQPALYLLVAAAGVGARNLLDRVASFEQQIAEQERRSAAEAERASLARDLHDSLAKTVAGIGFSALAVERRIDRDPAGAKAEARRLAEDARHATREAREIIVALRGEVDASGGRPTIGVLHEIAIRWSRTNGVPVDVAIDDVGELHPVAARELEWILREALGNVLQHANASGVSVRLRAFGARAVLTVADNGRGFEVPEDSAPNGHHFGLEGMRERARLAGGGIDFESAPGEGCVVSVWVPVEVPVAPAQLAAPPAAPVPAPAPAPSPAEPSPHDAPDASLPRPVPGFTWQ
jgi:signal transduction histidine kinase